MLEPITTPIRKRAKTVYDLEWIPGTLVLRLVGVFDERGYRCYTSISSFLNGELTSENRGRWFYAHAGGLYDVQFVFYELMNRKDPLTAVHATMSGSSAIKVSISRGKNAWTFLDSYRLMPDSLQSIGKWIGLEKGEGTDYDNQTAASKKEWFKNVNIHTLIDYNRRDCEILFAAINLFERLLIGMGGQLQATLASSAMQLFRRKYLSASLESSTAINEIARQAYYASRVEVFQKKAPQGGNYYDINSSFPWSMTQPAPGELIRSYTNLPTDLVDDENRLFMSRVHIRIQDQYLPPIPYRAKESRLYFPSGTWECWLDCVDIRLIERSGGRIISCSETYEFRPFYDLCDYALDLYKRRKEATSDFEKTFYKLLLNSLYGKFAESEDKSAIVINPPNTSSFSREDMLSPGVWAVPQKAFAPHVMVPISMHITSLSRERLYDFLLESEDFHYCDTDGFSTTSLYATGKELGQLKLEKRFAGGVFEAPKIYGLDGVNAVLGVAEFPIRKAKGFSLGKDSPKAIAKFESLLAGQDIAIERMVRLREGLNKKYIVPHEMVMKKGLKRDPFGKRSYYPDGDSRPWDVSELKQR